MKDIYDIDSLSKICGYFYKDENRVYGCNHPDNNTNREMIMEEDGWTRYATVEEVKNNPSVFLQGICMASTCPLGHLCHIEDLKEWEHYAYDEIVDNNPNLSYRELDDMAMNYDLVLVNCDKLTNLD